MVREFIDTFFTSVYSRPARVEQMILDINRARWEIPAYGRFIRSQIDISQMQLAFYVRFCSTEFSDKRS